MDGVTRADLLEAVAAAGLPSVSPSQLKRLRRAGLLPRPAQQHRSGVPGSVTVYPAWTTDQLLAILRLQQRAKARPLDQVAFWAWWDEHWVARSRIRNLVLHWVASSVRVLTDRLRRHADPLDAVDSLMAELGDRIRGPAWLRRRLGRDAVAGLEILALIMSGGQPTWDHTPLSEIDPDAPDEPTPADLVERSFALDKMSEEAGPESPIHGPLVPVPPEPQQLVENLQAKGLLDPRRWVKAVRGASVEELAAARSVARPLVEDFPLVVEGMRQVAPDPNDPWGLGSIEVLGDRSRRSLERCAQTVAWTVMLLRAPPAGFQQDVLEAIQSAAEEIRIAKANT